MSMDDVYEKFVNHGMPRGANVCSWLFYQQKPGKNLPIGLVAVEFVKRLNNKPWFILVTPSQESQFGNRSGMIKYRLYKTLSGLISNGPPSNILEMDYFDFMRKYIWSNHYFCSNFLLDI